MPSVLVDATISGGDRILSGNYFSGYFPGPVGTLLLKNAPSGGIAYVSLSGPLTINSGTDKSGRHVAGVNDGIPLAPGDTYSIPKLGVGVSGDIQIRVGVGTAGSGITRVHWEIF